MRGAWIAGTILAGSMTTAMASSLNLTTGTSDGSGGSSITSYGSGSGTALGTTGTTSYGFSDSFNGSSADQGDMLLGNPSSCSGNASQCYGFYDDFKITVTNGSADAVSVSVNGPGTTGVDNMQIRIYSADLNSSPVTGSGTPVGTVYQSWLTITNVSGGIMINTANLGLSPLQSGDYWVEIRGLVSGTSGAYGGSLNFTAQPVPLPAALPLMLSGLGLLGAGARRRRTRV